MAIDRKFSKKAPSQNPTAFYKCEQQGGTHGKATRVGDKLTGGPQREKVMGKSDLSRQ